MLGRNGLLIRRIYFLVKGMWRSITKKRRLNPGPIRKGLRNYVECWIIICVSSFTNRLQFEEGSMKILLLAIIIQYELIICYQYNVAKHMTTISSQRVMIHPWSTMYSSTFAQLWTFTGFMSGLRQILISAKCYKFLVLIRRSKSCAIAAIVCCYRKCWCLAVDDITFVWLPPTPIILLCVLLLRLLTKRRRRRRGGGIQ